MTKPSDELLKRAYAQDASIYQETPESVAFPASAEEVVALVRSGKPLIPRAAGTSLAGQVVGDGIVLDTGRHMNAILHINVEEQWAEVQPGVVRDELNDHLKEHGLFFGPNTSTSNRCMMGGMVGNNSSGSTSIEYGTTRDHVIEMTVILSDGSEVVFNAKSSNDFHEKHCDTSLEGKLYQHIQSELSNPSVTREIDINFPKKTVTRRNTGYAIDALLNSKLFSDSSQDFNFSKLLTGSEGTLAFTTEITLQLDKLPPVESAMVALHFESIATCLKSVSAVMQYNLHTCEMMDNTILDLTKHNKTQQANRT